MAPSDAWCMDMEFNVVQVLDRRGRHGVEEPPPSATGFTGRWGPPVGTSHGIDLTLPSG